MYIFCCLRLIKSQAVSMLFAALFPNRSAAVEQATENIEFVQVSVGCLPRFALLHSAPLSGIEVLAGIITGVCRKEVVSILQRKQRNVAALMFKAFRRKECHGKGMLIIIRNKPALNSIADGFPSLVVLIINVAPLYAGSRTFPDRPRSPFSLPDRIPPSSYPAAWRHQ